MPEISKTVFDVEYSADEGGSYGCLICLEGNLTPGYQGIRQYDGPEYGDGNSYNLPTLDLFDSFEYQDPRREATCLDIDDFIAENPEIFELMWSSDDINVYMIHSIDY